MSMMVFTLCCVLLVFAVAVTTAPAKEPLIVAHRGASFDAPENTLAAFRLAWQQGADGIEGDFRLTADGRIVCIHDEDTKRVGGSQLIVKASAYAQLKGLDVGTWKGDRWRGESIPTLEDVLAVLPKGRLLFAELKTGPEIVAPLAEVLNRECVAPEQIVLISFNVHVMIACKQALPRFKRHLLVDYKQEAGSWRPTADEVIARFRQAEADGLGTQNRPQHFNEDFRGRLRAAGIEKFHVWTVDSANEAEHYRALGAWAITTNRPAELRAALAR
jgi:glycerophosphoryl diester phosphodiesterase